MPSPALRTQAPSPFPAHTHLSPCSPSVYSDSGIFCFRLLVRSFLNPGSAAAGSATQPLQASAEAAEATKARNSDGQSKQLRWVVATTRKCLAGRVLHRHTCQRQAAQLLSPAGDLWTRIDCLLLPGGNRSWTGRPARAPLASPCSKGA